MRKLVNAFCLFETFGVQGIEGNEGAWRGIIIGSDCVSRTRQEIPDGHNGHNKTRPCCEDQTQPASLAS
jgi:hypothetical protein